MADVKWIKLATDIFDNRKIKLIEKMPEGDSIIVIWLKLLCLANLKNRQGVQEFKIANIELTDDVLGKTFSMSNKMIVQHLQVLEDNGFIERLPKSILIIPWWIDRHDRNSTRYRDWRASVFERDGYTCQGCGTKNLLQAHHIVHWEDCADNTELRYATENGITLCRACHLEAHGGCWRK